MKGFMITDSQCHVLKVEYGDFTERDRQMHVESLKKEFQGGGQRLPMAFYVFPFTDREDFNNR